MQNIGKKRRANMDDRQGGDAKPLFAARHALVPEDGSGEILEIYDPVDGGVLGAVTLSYRYRCFQIGWMDPAAVIPLALKVKGCASGGSDTFHGPKWYGEVTEAALSTLREHLGITDKGLVREDRRDQDPPDSD